MSGLPTPATFVALDWAMLTLVALSALVSLWRGFSREALSLLGWVVAWVAANLAGANVAAALAPWVANDTGRYLLAWVGLFVVVLIAFGLLGRAFAKLVRASGLGLLDRLLGTVFGALRGLLILMALLYGIRMLVPAAEQDALRQAQLLPVVEQSLDWSLRTLASVRPELAAPLTP